MNRLAERRPKPAVTVDRLQQYLQWDNAMTDELKEMVVQKLPHRCPYCDQAVSYEGFDLKEGENFIVCPSCHRSYIKEVSLEFGNRDPEPSSG